jgi:hypothetical protein
MQCRLSILERRFVSLLVIDSRLNPRRRDGNWSVDCEVRYVNFKYDPLLH